VPSSTGVNDLGDAGISPDIISVIPHATRRDLSETRGAAAQGKTHQS
jgi:hypothetical protein